MVKDSSLVSVLGVADITQMAKVYASGSFRFFETYSIVAYIYLVLMKKPGSGGTGRVLGEDQSADHPGCRGAPDGQVCEGVEISRRCGRA
jgi:hypothetical protein